MAVCTRPRTPALAGPPLRTRDTVLIATLARSATARMVGLALAGAPRRVFTPPTYHQSRDWKRFHIGGIIPPRERESLLHVFLRGTRHAFYHDANVHHPGSAHLGQLWQFEGNRFGRERRRKSGG